MRKLASRSPLIEQYAKKTLWALEQIRISFRSRLMTDKVAIKTPIDQNKIYLRVDVCNTHE